MKEYGVRRDPRYRLFATETLCEGAVVRVTRERVRLPHGHETEQDVLHLPPAVGIVPLLEEGGERHVILVEQFRNSVRGHIHEIPAGLVEEGEELEACARRELEEETGFRAGEMRHLASLLMIPGTSAHRMHFFLARKLSAGHTDLDPAECLRVRKVPYDPLVRRLISDAPGSTPVVDSKTHLGLLQSWLVLSAPDALEGSAEGSP